MRGISGIRAIVGRSVIVALGAIPLMGGGAWALPGDVNGNNLIDDADGALIVDHLLGRGSLGGSALQNADLNTDGALDVADGILITDLLNFPAFPSIAEASPAHGEQGVAVTRETIVRLDSPIDPATVGSSALVVKFGQTTLSANIHVAPDERTLTLFYPNQLPASGRVRVMIDGGQIKGRRGLNLDADGDGVPGGIGALEFDTLNLSSVPGSSVYGRVFASELAPNGSESVNVPLAGVVITVDGRPDLNAVTDQNGDFRLEDSPAGRFFVHIDGRPVTQGFVNGQPHATSFPNGYYYPYVGKVFPSAPGTEISAGEIYLPLISPGSLTPVSPMQDTMIEFTPSVLEEHPELTGVQIMVPGDSLYADDGTRGGSVGIAPVPPDRIPGHLPPGLEFALVITVQTDGATNFDRPVPACFPNLPDPQTGQELPPGAKSALWSFNHDTGQFEIVGSMTVSDDGQLVCTDPGVGILAPGWHGSMPGSQGNGGNTVQGCGLAVSGPDETKVLSFFDMQAFSTGTAPITWTAPGGNPPSGTGDTFTVSYGALGPKVITARTTINNRTCQVSHTVNIIPDVEIFAPSEVDWNTEFDVTSSVSPTGGSYQWEFIPSHADISNAIDPDITAKLSRHGLYTLVFRYQLPNSNETVELRRTINSKVDLKIVQAGSGEELPEGFLLREQDALNVYAGLPNGFPVYTYDWLAGPDADPGSGGQSYFGTKFTSVGDKLLQLRISPSYGGDPLSVTRSLYVAQECRVRNVGDAAFDLQIGQNGTWTFEGEPAGGTMRITADGGLPFQVDGNTITTNFADPGFHSVAADYQAPNGGSCSGLGWACVQPIPCQIQINAPADADGTEPFPVSFQFPNYSDGQALIVFCGQSIPAHVNSNGQLSTQLVCPLLGPQTLLVNYSGSAGPSGACPFNCGAQATINIISPPAPVNFPQDKPVASPAGPTAVMNPGPVTQSAADLSGGAIQKAEGDPTRGLHYYALVDIETDEVVQRDFAGSNGVAHPRLIVRPGRKFRSHVLQASTLWVGQVEFTSGDNGRSFTIPDIVMNPSSAPDTDGDDLPDDAEFIMGTNKISPDSDGDGVPDGAEVTQGLNPLDGFPARTGLTGQVDTPGSGEDIMALNDLAVVADGEQGVTIFNVFNGMEPMIVAQVDTPGEGLRASLGGDYIGVADGAQGLTVIDISMPGNAAVARTLNLGARVTAVATAGQIAFAGLSDGQIIAVDMASGGQFARAFLGVAIQDLHLAGDYLYAVRQDGVFALALVNGVMQPTGFQALNSARRVFTAPGDVLYAVHSQGFSSYSLANPGQPALIAHGTTSAFGWRAGAANGSGLGVFITGANSTNDSPHSPVVYDLRTPSQTNALLATYAPPSSGKGLSIYGGLSYIADGDSGMAIVNYMAYDTLGVRPMISVSSNFVGGQAEENKLMRLTAAVSDDVQVRNVEFYLNGELILTDGNFPFEARFLTPALSTGSTFNVRARVFDTGGNYSWSPLTNYTITADATAPQVIGTFPQSSAHVQTGQISAVQVSWSEAIDQTTLSPGVFQIFGEGPDQTIDTTDDVPITGSSVDYVPEQNLSILSLAPLARGNYRCRILSSVRDLAGNTMAAAYSWTFRFGDYNPPYVSQYDPPVGPAGGSIMRVRAIFNEALDPSSVTAGSLMVTDHGADFALGTGDDQTVSGNVSYDSGSSAVVFTPGAALPASRFTARISGAVRDLAGNTLGQNQTWSFGLGSFEEPQVIRTRPGHWVVYSEPDNYYNLEAQISRIELEWSESMDAASFTADRLVMIGGGPDFYVGGADDVTLTNYTVSFPTPEILRLQFPAPLAPGDYELTIRSNVADIFGNLLTGDIDWTLRLGDINSPYYYDYYPAVNYPEDRLGFGTDRAISIWFDNPLDPATVTAENFNLVELGPDRTHGTADDVVMTGGTVTHAPSSFTEILKFESPLPVGRYRASFLSGGTAPVVRKLSGAPMYNGEQADWFFDVTRGVNLIDTTGASFTSGLASTSAAGMRITSLGDINNDSYDDIGMGVPFGEGSSLAPGGVYIFYGSGSALSGELTPASADASFLGSGQEGLGFGLDPVGDLNDDGFDDFAIQSYSSSTRIIFGQAASFGFGADPLTTPTLFTNNMGMGRGGDLNGDGLDDLVAVKPNNSDNSGEVRIFFGHGSAWPGSLSAEEADVSLLGPAPGRSLGNRWSAGDLNGDGINDLAIQAQGASSDSSYRGVVYVVLGRASWPASSNVETISDASYIGETDYYPIGDAVAIAPDLNGDAKSDLLISWRTSTNGPNFGRTHVIFGRASGWPTAASLNVADASFDGMHVNQRIGADLAGVGDFDGDGLGDFLVGAPDEYPPQFTNYQNDRGAAYLVFGRAGGWPTAEPIETSALALMGYSYHERAGERVSLAGDVNNDGRPDVLVFSGGDQYRPPKATLVYGPDVMNAPHMTRPRLGSKFPTEESPGGLGGGLTSVEATFTQELDPASLTTANFRVFSAGADGLTPSEDDVEISGGAVSYDGPLTPVALTFAAPLPAGLYRASLSGMSNPAGNEIDPVEWTFRVIPTRFDTDAPISFSRESRDSRIGSAMAAGDLNGDGKADLAFGSYDGDFNIPLTLPQGGGGSTPLVEDRGEVGGVFVMFGGAGLNQDMSLFASDVTIVGDQDDNTGQAVAAADVNGDGLKDLLVGAPTADPGAPEAGRVYIILGRGGSWPAIIDLRTDADVIINGETVGTITEKFRFGTALAAVGDVNGDGREDFLVGAPFGRVNEAEPATGRVYLFFGRATAWPATLSAGTADVIMEGAPGDEVGEALAAAGDFNNDGLKDIVVGAFLSSQTASYAGEVFLLLGRNSWPATISLPTQASASWIGAADSQSGRSLAAGDFNQDGFSDIAIGAPEEDGVDPFYNGAVHIISGRASGLALDQSISDQAAWRLIGTGDYEYLGESLAAGDLNQDGLADLLVGTTENEDRLGPPESLYTSGRVYLFRGESGGWPAPVLTSREADVSWVDNGEIRGGQLGASMLITPDVDGDSVPDLLLGAPESDDGESSSGDAYLFTGPQ